MKKKDPKACPVCGKPAVDAFKPFCSSRCSMVDLGAWLGEAYRLKTDEPDGETAGFSEPEPEK